MASPADLQALFPDFAAVPLATIQLWLDRAARVVDTRFPAEDRDHAQMLLAAHMMAQNGIGDGTDAQTARELPVGVKSFKSGSLSVERAEREGFEATVYGRQFAAIAKPLFTGPLIGDAGRLHYAYGTPLWGS